MSRTRSAKWRSPRSGGRSLVIACSSLSIIADCSTREKTWSRAWPAYGPKVLRPDGALWHDEHMQNWNRPDPLTRDLIHLINARRHDHWDADAAFDTLAELIEQNREDEILTVLAALDEDMAEWL